MPITHEAPIVMTHNRMKTLGSIMNSKIVPVFHHHDVEVTPLLGSPGHQVDGHPCPSSNRLQVAKAAMKATAAAGLTCFEWTNRGTGAYETFKQLAQCASRELPTLILGAGSVMDEATAAIYINNGASFIVGPCFDREVASLCNKRKVAYLPGCMTPTEVHKAHKYGSEIVKLFPGSAVGPKFVANIRGPMPFASIMPTGGVSPTQESVREWFSAGVVACGMGSQVFTGKAIEAGDWDSITATLRQCHVWAQET
eukprot:gene9485-1706_t